MRRKTRADKGGAPTLAERVCRYLEIAPDAMPGESMIEIRGRNYMKIHGMGKILVYTPEEIKIRMKKGCLRVRGSKLTCVSYYKDAIGIEGRFSDISFCREE